MGTWAIPWEDLETAKRFANRMAEPWIASVSEVEEPDYGESRVGDEYRAGPEGGLVLFRKQGLFGRMKPAEPVGTKTSWEWEAEGLYDLFGDDSLFDQLGDEAESSKAAFDVRPAVRAQLREMFDEFGDELVGEEAPEPMNLVRAAVDLPPLA